MSGMAHIAGLPIWVGPVRRQRCAWCGAVLVDQDVTRMAVPMGQSTEPAVWPAGAQVMVDGGLSYVLPDDDGRLAPEACGRMHPEVTQ